MPINRAGLVTKVTTSVEESYLTAPTCVSGVLSNALSLNALNETNIITVASVDALPNLKYYSSPSGMVYFITNIETHAISTSEFTWISLDGRLIRADAFFSQAYGWGSNSDNGAVADGTFINRSSPVAIVGGFTDWCQVDATIRTFGIRANGTLWAWGCNLYGAIGNNTAANQSSPVSVVGGFTDWCQVSGGGLHTLAVRSSGTLWSWGRNCRQFFGNNAGALGDNSAEPRSSPVSVVGGFTDWCRASAGSYHSVGLRSNGTAWAWGCNNCGAVGDDTTINKSSPVSVVGGFTDWIQIGAGRCVSAGLRSNGTIWAWGSNGSGQLGDNTVIAKSSPVSVIGGFTDWCQISVGYEGVIALRTNGTAWSWGSGLFGALGDNTTVNKSSPVSVVGGFTNWCCVCLSKCAGRASGVRTDGTGWVWGQDNSGNLGIDISGANRSSPVQVSGGFTDWNQISIGSIISSGLRKRT